MKLLILKQINRVDRPDYQTVSFVRRITEWMSQWTVANNFYPIAVEDGEEETALLVWAHQFMNTMHQALPGNQKDRSYLPDFEFKWEEHKLELYKPIVYLRTNWLTLDKLEKKNETTNS